MQETQLKTFLKILETNINTFFLEQLKIIFNNEKMNGKEESKSVSLLTIT